VRARVVDADACCRYDGNSFTFNLEAGRLAGAKAGGNQPARMRSGMQEKRTMTKADIIDNVYEKVGGFSKKEAAEIVEVVFDTIKETLEAGEKIKISGFGNFVVRDKNSRIGRNPQTGQEITISARRVLTFKPSQVLKNALNS
jgi:integration host factor subunit alpha